VNLIAAKATVFKLAGEKDFVHIQKQTVANAVELAAGLAAKGYRIVTGGTDNHLVLVDLGARDLAGGAAEKALESVGIVANRNVIPGDEQSPGRVSGIRFGTAAVTTRGMAATEIQEIVDMIDTTLYGGADQAVLEQTRRRVARLCKRFPVYG
jgi:glycine hydroxymethyltransferase